MLHIEIKKYINKEFSEEYVNTLNTYIILFYLMFNKKTVCGEILVSNSRRQ